MSMEAIATLIRRAQAGEAEAYSALVGRFRDMAYGYAYAILGDFTLAQDAAQEAFIEAYQCLPALREPLAFPVWLKRIVLKHCDRLTRGKRLATVPLDDAARVASPRPGPEEVAERNEMARAVRDAVGELPPPQREVTTLFYINGYSHQEIADFLGVPAKTVKSRLHASRSRLRERMVGMVEDELKANALPPGFTQETVEQAVARATELNKERQYDQAEEVLRRVLAQFPDQPEALRELTRTLNGRVYTDSRWDLLGELAERGRAILQATDDEHIARQVAKTLLATPAMPDAIAFLEDWIARKGPNLERLGMLAWAKGCVADYDAAEAPWSDFVALARPAPPEEILGTVSFVAYTLVDCFAQPYRDVRAPTDELPRAQRVAQQAWELRRDLGGTPPALAKHLIWKYGYPADTGWLYTFHLARLDLGYIIRTLIEWQQGETDARARGQVLCVQGWMEDPQVLLPVWLDWVRERLASGEAGMVQDLRWQILRGPYLRFGWRAGNEMAQETWELLRRSDDPKAQEQLETWDYARLDPSGAIAAGEWDAAEEILQRQARECSRADSYWSITLAARRGLPSPPELVRAIEEGGIAAIDRYGMIGWYLVARDAAAVGDEAKAFDALRKALSYWTNPPYANTATWENDAYWGALRGHPEFTRAFEEKRRRIGPVYGLLHYFPGW